MNRLILVGNGFDLAHGLKTSYCDFITDYLVKALNTLQSQKTFEDDLLLIKRIDNRSQAEERLGFPVTEETVFTTLSTIQKGGNLNLKFKSSLLQKTISQVQNIKWVDLENDYFDELLACKGAMPNSFNDGRVKLLNDQFQFIREELEKYLLRVQLSPGIPIDPNIAQVFNSPIQIDDLLQDKYDGGKPPKEKLFLNFNYTNTLDKYLGKCSTFKPTLGREVEVQDTQNQIHGRLDDPHNPVIFGFGDEYNTEYQKFEGLKNDEVLRHIKSFAYLQTRNYHDLVGFLMLDNFQVYVVGHSCGLSDRTMFREIFNHDNCKSIKIFYYEQAKGNDDFRQKTYAIARHFIDKGDFRKKVVSKPLSSPLPQYDQRNLLRKKG